MSRLLLLSVLLLFVSCQNEKSENGVPSQDDKRKFIEEMATKKIERKFASFDIDSKNFEMFITIYKLEQIVQLWARELGTDGEYQKVAQYAFCKISGVLGPKRKENDLQIPEGLYHINVFNPESKYHRSLGINYPNASDLILSDKENPGNEIYIHGGCSTVGCVPITDSWISELYIASKRASNKGQKDIPVYMFPYAMIEAKFEEFKEIHPQHLPFWSNLKTAFDRIAETNMPIDFSVDEKGNYILK